MNQAKTTALLEHLLEGGPTDKETLAEVLSLSVNSIRSIQSYLDAAGEEDETFSDLSIGDENPVTSDDEEGYGGEDDEDEDEDEEQEPEPEPEPEAKKKKKGKKDFRFFYTGPDNRAVELEISSKNESVINFVAKPVTDEVKIMVKGKILLVDIVPLRKLPATDNHTEATHLTNDAVLKLALAAK